MSKTASVKIILVAIISLVLFAGIVYFLKSLLIPRLPIQWQSNLALFIGSLIVAIAILSGIAQFTGLGLKDIFTLNKSSIRPNIVQKQRDSVILHAHEKGEISWNGDVFQHGSTKVVLNDRKENWLAETSEDIERLIRDIQTNLHSDNSRLPYILTLCKDLCDRVGLTKKYDRWLRRELTGYEEDFKKDFDDEEDFNAWMNIWARRRLIRTYVKTGYRSQETGQYWIDEFPFREVIIGQSVAELASKITVAQKNGVTEFSMALRNLSQDYYSELQSFLKKAPLKMEMPDDLEVFFRVSDYEKILTGVRDITLTLLSDVRQQQRRFE